MDQLQESYAIALVPLANGKGRAALLAHPNCRAVRERSDALHAVFDLAPAMAAQAIERDLGVKGARCRTVALEEMFIEMVEGQS